MIYCIACGSHFTTGLMDSRLKIICIKNRKCPRCLQREQNKEFFDAVEELTRFANNLEEKDNWYMINPEIREQKDR